MDNLARLKLHDSTTHDVGTVIALETDGLLLRTARGDRRAARATSCLVAPAVGDEVLVVTVPDGRMFVLAVLSRDTSSVELKVDGAMRVTSKTLELDAEEGTLRFDRLGVLASSLLAHAESAHLAVKTVNAFCDRLSQTVKTCLRTVEELDQLRAGRLDYRTEKEMQLRAENILAGSRGLVKVDGEQIHLG